jgi:hypothetical protein
MTQVALVVLGWLFGLLTGPIAEGIRRRRARASLAQAIEFELADIRDQAVMLEHQVHVLHGTLSRSGLQRTIDGLKDSPSEGGRGAREVLTKLLERGEDAIDELNAHLQKPTTNLSFRALEMPFLMTQLHQIDVFSAPTQQRLLRLKTDIRMFNELAAEVSRYSEMTFNVSVVDDNRARVVGNLRQAERSAQQRAVIIADSIAAIGKVH